MFDALADLREAQSIAAEVGEERLELEIMIEQSTVLDHCEDFETSKRVAEQASEKLAALSDAPPGFAIDLELAAGRSLFRTQQFADAAPTLRRALVAARNAARPETATIAALLLGCALSDMRQLDEAETVFAELIDLCVARGDRYHLGAAYGNRAWYWSARGEIERTAEDLRSVIQIARESGQAQLERAATHNLAEHLLWEGRFDEALQLARRGLALQTAGGEGTTTPDRLLLARVLAAVDEQAELASVLETFTADDEGGDDQRVALGVLRAIAADDRDAIATAIAGIDVVFAQMRLELAALAAAHGALPQEAQQPLIELASVDPIWRARISDLSSQSRGGRDH
jgi:tetratricopeptide (TPR) repeat protein